MWFKNEKAGLNIDFYGMILLKVLKTARAKRCRGIENYN